MVRLLLPAPRIAIAEIKLAIILMTRTSLSARRIAGELAEMACAISLIPRLIRLERIQPPARLIASDAGIPFAIIFRERLRKPAHRIASEFAETRFAIFMHQRM